MEEKNRQLSSFSSFLWYLILTAIGLLGAHKGGLAATAFGIVIITRILFGTSSTFEHIIEIRSPSTFFSRAPKITLSFYVKKKTFVRDHQITATLFRQKYNFATISVKSFI